MSNYNIVVLASGNGSNLQSLIDCSNNNILPISISLVVSDQDNSLALSRANINKIPTLLLKFNSSEETREDYDTKLAFEVMKMKPDIVVCAGWMRILSDNFIKRFDNIINLHPALPGKFPGADAISEALNKFKSGDISNTGVMVHHVIQEIDAGKVIDYTEVPIYCEDTVDSLRERVQKAEKPLLINSLMKLILELDLARNTQTEKDLKSLNTKSLPDGVISGKVRDRFDIGYNLMGFYHSDRLSSFDRHICNINGKGRLLNLINKWWMDRTQDIIPNHLIHIDGNYLIAKKCQVIPLEIIVRGYITGSTSTSLWTHYAKGVRNYCGIDFKDGLKKNQKLENPVITPTTKGEIDELISREEILNRNIVNEEELDFIYQKALELFDYGSKVASQKGLILVDTKYEFGYDKDGNIILIDEIHTCDSSRYWLMSSYLQRLMEEKEPEKLDKDSVRDYVKKICDPYNEPIPEIPDDHKLKVLKCYQTLYMKLINEEKCDIDSPGDNFVDRDIVIDNYFFNHHKNMVVIFSGSPSDSWHIKKLVKEFKSLNIYHEEHICSAHKKTQQLLDIIGEYNKKNKNIIFITVAGRSNALSGVVVCNTHFPVIACPPFKDKNDMHTNIHSTLQMPSKVPTMTILEPNNVALACDRIFNLC